MELGGDEIQAGAEHGYGFTLNVPADAQPPTLRGAFAATVSIGIYAA